MGVFCQSETTIGCHFLAAEQCSSLAHLRSLVANSCWPSDEGTWLDLGRTSPPQFASAAPPTASSLPCSPLANPPHRRSKSKPATPRDPNYAYAGMNPPPPISRPPRVSCGCTRQPSTHRQASRTFIAARKGRARGRRAESRRRAPRNRRLRRGAR